MEKSILENFDLHGKRALITGCRTGIGRAITLKLASAGATIIGVSSRLDKEDSPVGREVEERGGTWIPSPCNLADRRELYHLVGKVKSDHGGIDILVNNAGIIRRAVLKEHTDELWEEVLNLNLNTPFILSREFAPSMVERGRGKIIFIASLLSFQGGITVPGYSASKGGIKQLVMALSNELAPSGVCVNAIAPGYIETAATKELREDPVRSKNILDRIPAGRWGKPEDIAGAALFLASGASDYIMGTTLVVDGGWMGR